VGAAAKLYGLFAIGCAATMAPPVYAIGTPCIEMTDADSVSAVVAARAVLDGRWLQTPGGWGAAYAFKTQPRNPFALKAMVPEPAAEPSIEGLMAARSINCSAYEVAAPRAYIVRFTAEALRFNENGGGWTRPLPLSVIMIVSVEQRGPVWVARNLPEARTAIPPSSVLRHPTAQELASFEAGKPIPRKTAGFRR
jgi:hypothetical protein